MTTIPMSSYTTWKQKDCHNGNTLIYKEPNGGSLYIGGWNMGAKFDWNTHVIDLTGTEHKFWDVPFAFDNTSQKFMPFLMAGYKGWLSLPFPDYKVPQNLSTYQQWHGIAMTIQDILKQGTDVLVACHGGHGRSGLFVAIVGYILAINKDRSWSSPVEKVRKLHCFDAVETFEQERFVYAVLGLDIQITRKYIQTTTLDSAGRIMRKYEICPICGKESQYIKEYGMCLACQVKYEKEAPVRADLTIKDIEHKGEVEHSCQRDNCVGIWKAEKCGHVVHDQLIIEGFCGYCTDRAEEESRYAEQKMEEIEGYKLDEMCVICGEFTLYAKRFGVCYDCAEEIQKEGKVDFVHNTITDPYTAYPHNCNDVACVGLVTADVCGHTVHNREIEDGKCPECLLLENKLGKEKVQ